LKCTVAATARGQLFSGGGGVKSAWVFATSALGSFQGKEPGQIKKSPLIPMCFFEDIGNFGRALQNHPNDLGHFFTAI